MSEIFDNLQRDHKYTTVDISGREQWERILKDSGEFMAPIYFVNSYSCFLANRNSQYSSVLAGGICVIDGKPLKTVISQSRQSVTIQNRGIDFFSTVLETMSVENRSQFFFGSTQEVCQEISDKLKRRGGSEIPYICPPDLSSADFDSSKYISEMEKYKPELIWVALGTPKQDFIANALSKRMPGVAIAAVGAAFNFYSGHKKEAPLVLQALYLEWLFRLISEPRRLWRRYILGNAGFIADVLRWRLNNRKLTE